MFPKPPRPEPPRRAIAMQVVQHRVATQPAPNVLIVDRPPGPETPPPATPPAKD